jgi:uncharacterized SAM-binding protein YcdF (DUF218 family)
VKKALFVVGGGLIVLVLLGVAGFFWLGFFLSPQNPLVRSDAIVAISGGETNSRTMEAIKLYKEGWAPKLIFSGAAQDTSGPSNARAMENIALANGVPQSAIYIDETAANTAQNAQGVAAIIHDRDIASIILVTSPYHQRRAFITFRDQLGGSFPIVNHSTTDQNWRRSHWWANAYSTNLTLSELQKTLYVMWRDR